MVPSRVQSSASSSSTPVERGAGDHQPGAQLLLLLLGAVLDDAEAADQPRQREALHDDGDEDQREGDELDQLAARQRRAAVGLSGSASAAASDTAPRMPAQPPTTRRASCARRATLRRPTVERPDQVRDEKFQTKRTAITAAQTGRRVADDLAGGPAREPVEDHRQLQPDQDEQRRVEQEGEHRPHPVRLHPALRRGDLGGAEAEIDAAGRPRRGRRRRRAGRRGRTPRRR